MPAVSASGGRRRGNTMAPVTSPDAMGDGLIAKIGAGCGPGCAVVAAPHLGAEPFAANGPGFSVAVCYEIGKCEPG